MDGLERPQRRGGLIFIHTETNNKFHPKNFLNYKLLLMISNNLYVGARMQHRADTRRASVRARFIYHL
jgi:hypothetical protein